MATIYDVATRAGVSVATVSRVLNGRRGVGAGMAERVRAAAAELDYRPNAVARNLRRSSTTLWAAIVSDIENPFFTSLVRGVEDVAQEAGYSVVLCNSDEDPGKESAYVAAVRAEQIAGVILSPSGRMDTLRELRDAGTPTVLIDRSMAGYPTDAVLVDNERGAADATRHLIAGDYRRIACITGPRRLSTAAERLAGYRRALREADMPYDRSLVRYADFRETGGNQAMAALLGDDPGPDAVFVTNNLMAVGVLEHLAAAGRRVPADVAVVAFDEIPWADLVRPSITTVAQPTYDLGRAAATLLLDRIKSPGRPPSVVTLQTQLRVRGSSVPKTTAAEAGTR